MQLSPYDPHKRVYGGRPFAERFWDKVVTLRDPDACWGWLASLNEDGYGRLQADTKKYRPATHVSWFLHRGVWPEFNLLHSCDNPPCTNIRHLSEGNQKENMQQAAKRGRLRQQKVTHCPQGHPYDSSNTRFSQGRRICRACVRQAMKSYLAQTTDNWLLYCSWCQKEFSIKGGTYRHKLKIGQLEICCSISCGRKLMWHLKPAVNDALKASYGL